MIYKFLKMVDFVLFSLLPATLLYLLYILLFKVEHFNIIIPMLISLCILIYLPYLFYRFHMHENLTSSIKEHTITILFVLYLLHLSYFTFFAHLDYVANSLPVANTYLRNLSLQWRYHTNIIPFFTLLKLVEVIKNPYISNYYPFLFVLIRLCLYMPFAYFLPNLFPKLKKPIYFILLILLIAISFEFLQFFTFAGLFNIDDIIFHVFGAVNAYFLIHHVS